MTQSKSPKSKSAAKRNQVSSKGAKPSRWREARILIGLGVIAAVGFLVGIIAVNRQQSANSTPTNAANLKQTTIPGPYNPANNLIYTDSPTLGPTNAKVTLVEFLDPECESCRAMFPIVKQIMKEYDGRLKLVVRYFPLHGNSVLAAVATEAAGEQGKYWEMQELLFNQQTDWGEKQTPQTELFTAYAKQLGLDTTKFAASLQNMTYTEKVKRDYNDATALGLRGTPSFFVNGQAVDGLSYQSLKTLIDKALQS